MLGHARFHGAMPGPAHHALAALERRGRVVGLVTQNVDGLHTRAGQRAVIDLHGRLDAVRCMACGERSARADLQQRLVAANGGLLAHRAVLAPDGDADLDDAVDLTAVQVPACASCGGVLKPDVVFFGENVPRERVERVAEALAQADALLVVGSSLMVRSGLRWVEAAVAAGKPVAALNLGVTRADALLSLKLDAPIGPTLNAWLARTPAVDAPLEKPA